MSDESHPRTLYVGNLDISVTEDLLRALFSHIGKINGCKVIREPGNDPYAFIEFASHEGASSALLAMNKRTFLEKEMKVNWATSPGNQPKTDTSNHYHIFVGDLSPEIETQTLKEAFAPFGEISNCRIVRDPQTLKSKGYAFVSFVKKAEAEIAINSMNGQWLGNRSIRTNWSTRKPPPPRSTNTRQNSNNKNVTYDEVYNQSSPTNCTVYCGGFTNGMSEELMQNVFSQFGTIVDIRAFKDKGYAFIKFSNKESATRAIEAVHNTEINGQSVKCFWGKESGDPTSTMMNSGGVGAGSGNSTSSTLTNSSNAAAMQYGYNMYGGQMSYWGYPYSTAATAGGQMQGQYYQGMQPSYGYGQFGAYQPTAAGYVAGRVGVPVASQSSTWPATATATAATTGTSPQSAQSVATTMAYGMPQFQNH